MIYWPDLTRAAVNSLLVQHQCWYLLHLWLARRRGQKYERAKGWITSYKKEGVEWEHCEKREAARNDAEGPLRGKKEVSRAQKKSFSPFFCFAIQCTIGGLVSPGITTANHTLRADYHQLHPVNELTAHLPSGAKNTSRQDHIHAVTRLT